mmetsp:Transcript_171503/g.549705  ORF Transcript_171503/g.549705 Transcript_171503/m.549705 type:complete len:239 (+) Transcript_171503:381-1097(+)
MRGVAATIRLASLVMAIAMAMPPFVPASVLAVGRIVATSAIGAVLLVALAVAVALVAVAMAMFLLLQEALVDLLQHLVQREGLDAQQEIHVAHGILCSPNLRRLVDGTNFPVHLLQVLRVNQVGLVQKDAVCERDLRYGLVDDTLRLLLAQMFQAVLGIHDGEDAVQHHVVLHELVREEGLGHRRRVGQARRLDDDAVERLALASGLPVELLQARNEVAPDCAADAPIVHLDDVLLGH